MSAWRGLAARTCSWVAGAFLAAMMLLIVADVLLRKLANTPIRGMFELVELLLACTFFFALPATFLRDENLVVDLLDGWMPRAVGWLKRASALLAVAMLSLIAWQSFISARDALSFGDVTADLALPKILYWIPLLAGIGGAAIAAAAMVLKPDDAR